ncbi:autotransporter-associated beta strand repeat-containing protein [Prosthecobacter sp.]|uniref:autotransporter-associated beta strand repeat-containing protein n=1 Tax=Prosthecobacter sp. TaxID=1965333 RepID=UPI00248A30BE|nr:autotransporter-associated beta strand repeat-containing protein [Prosthecobacter sp.]MDI1311653.1 autotransporter-associated beta strand repeat-containing protein [Prosthecobacter sp.]
MDTAIFSAPAALLPTLNTITLSSGITAGQLSFLRSGFLLTGGDLTLAGTDPTLSAALAETATIDSQILGVDGLTIQGGGTIRLTNAANAYTGTTTISNGTLSINSNEALGADSSTIVVTGSTTRGFTGGAILLEGGYSSGVTLTRDVSLQGLGPVPAFGAALLSVGNNTLAGALTNGSGTLSTGISSAGGRLTLNDVTLAGTTGTIFLTVGAGSSVANLSGLGSYAITGVLSGTGSIQKSGGGTLIVSPSDATGYTGTFRLYSGSMRFESVAAFGSNTGTGTLSTLDLAGDSTILELRMDNPNIGKNIYNRGGGSPIIVVDHAIGSSVLNGKASFGTLTYDDGESITFNGRNGYGVSIGATPVITGDGNTTFANNLNGTLTFTGDFWNNINNTGNRTFTIGGNGNTVIFGSIIATAATFGHSVIKSGTGTLTVTGSASTYSGNTTISAGTLSVVNLGGINKDSATGSILLGSTTAAAAFQYTGAADTLAKPFSLGGTTGGGAILADGTGALTFTGTVGAGGVGIKTLFLGGGNKDNNTFSGFLLDNTSTNTTGLMKIGSGTWVLQEPTAVTTGVSKTVTIAAPGTTAITVLTLSSGTTAGMVVGQTLVLPGSTQQITGIIDNTHFTIGTAVTTTTAPAGTYSVNVIPAASTATAGGTWSGPLSIANGVLKLQATNAASNIVPDANAVIFNLDTYALNQTAGGTLEFVGVAGQATTETLGTLVPGTGLGTVKVMAGADGTATLTFAALAESSTTTLSTALSATGSTTLTVASTAGLAPGMKLLNGSVAAYIVSISSTTAVVMSATQVSLASGTVLNFGPGNATVNYVTGANSSVVFANVPAVGLLNSSSYFNGTDFAYAPDTVNAILRAPVYDTDAGFVTAGAALAANSHNLVMGNTSTGAATVLSLKIDGTASPVVTQTGLLTIRTGAAGTTGGILVTGGPATIAGTGVTTGGAGDLVIRVDGASDTLFLNAPVTATTTGGLIKTGAGTLVIGGLNAQTAAGITQLQEGTIQLVTGGRLSANSVNFFMRQDTVLDLNGVNVSQSATSSSIGNFSGTGTVTNTSATSAIFAIAGSAGVFNGTIDEVNGQISVVKMGTTSTQIFNGLSNYTGSTTIGVAGNGTTGTLSAFYLADIGHDSSIGRGDGSSLAANQGSLIFGGTTGGLVYTGNTSVSIDRLFTLAGTGATITNNAVNNQTLIFSNTNPFAFAAAKPQLFQLSGTSSGDNIFNPQIKDSGTGANITSFNKLGTGLWILGNTNNAYTGTTTITDGMLMAQDGSTLPNASGLILGGTTTSGILQSSGNFTRDLAPSASAGVNTVSWNSALTTGGGGFAATTDKLVVAIGGLATPTALTWGSGGFMGTTGTGTGPLVLNSITALGEVEFRNAIDLNGGTRTIQVNDNTTTFTDFATISGGISGTGGISKTGTGLLQLLGNNTYTGTTAVTAGQLVVTSLGNSATPGGASSIGDSTNANTTGSALTLGNASTTAGILQYIGAGETSDRMIRLNTTTGSTQILADGSGALILTNVVNDMAAGAKILYLRGGNTQGNMVTSVLANNGGNLSVNVDQGATWILSGNNTYTGTTNASAGALGIGSNTALGTSILNMRNGTVFAYGADRTLGNDLTVASTTSGGTFAFMGDYTLTLNGTWNYTNTTAGHTITNGIASGETLTINGNMVLNALTAGVSLAFNGTGDTTINGNITTSTAFGVSLSYTGDGTLIFSGVNSTIGNTTLNNVNGTVLVTGAGKLGSGALTVNAGSFSIESINQSVTTLTMGNVAGTTATLNVASGLTLSATAITFAGTTTLASTITGDGTLDLGAAGITVTVADNITQVADMIWSIDSLTGSNVFTKAGTGTLDISGIAHNNFTGSYQINAGAITGLDALTNNLVLNGGVYQTSGLFVRSLGTGSNQVQWLTLGGGFAAAGGDLTVTLAGAPSTLVWGSTSSFVPNAAPLIFGSTSADSVTTFTHDINLNGAVRTVTAVDNTTVTTDVAVLSGVLSNGGLTKTGNGVLNLSGANTFAGGLTVTTGTLQFTTIGNEGGGANNLGQGTLTLNGGILSFVGDGVGASQSTDRTLFGLATLSNLAANGTNGATITYAGSIDLTGMVASGSLLLTGTGSGFITGGIAMSGGSADIQPQSGTWTFSGTSSTLTDDFINTGASVVVNLNSTGVLTWGASPSTSPNFYLRGGAMANLGADNAITFASTSTLIMGDVSGTAAVNTLNMNGFNLTVPNLALGAIADVYAGVITGPGTLTVIGTGTLSRGSISANLAGTATLTKTGSGSVTLSGDNSGLNGTAATTISAGTLILDYTTQNNGKLNAGAALTMTGGTVQLEGNASADTTQNLNGLILSAGSSTIELDQGGTQSLTLNVGAITRNANGVIHLSLSANSHVLTSASNGFGDVLAGWATVNNRFAGVSGGEIVAVAAVAKDDLTTWAAGDNLTDLNGYFNTVGTLSVNSLVFESANASTVTIGVGNKLTIASGGILVVEGAGAGGITGGGLLAGITTGNLVITQNNTADDFTISSSITDSSITKAGAGTLVLGGNNDASDRTLYIGAGTVRALGGHAIGDLTVVTLSTSYGVDTMLDLSDQTERIGGLAGGVVNDTLRVSYGLVQLGATGMLINDMRAAATLTANLAGGDGSTFVKNGWGLLTTNSGASSFTGALIINQGGIRLDGNSTAQDVFSKAKTITLNGAGTISGFNSYLLSDQDQAASSDLIGNTASITLSNTAANTFNGVALTAIANGLIVGTNQNASRTETVGQVTLQNGQNSIFAYSYLADTSTASVGVLTMASLARPGHATVLVAGTRLGGAAALPTGRITITGVTSATINLIGGTGGGSTTADTPNWSIVPYMIGQTDVTNTTSETSFYTATGNSFVTYGSNGLRPLVLNTEYEQLVASGGVTVANNVRYSSASDLTLNGANLNMNSLLVDNSSSTASMTLNGAGASLNVASGAFLFTSSGATTPQGITLTNFSTITTSTAEYIVFVPSVAANTGVTLDAPMTTVAAALVKSGNGILKLTSNASTYGGGTWINQGLIEISTLDALGTGDVNFDGGGIRWAEGAAFDPSDTARALTFLSGGAVFDTNGNNVSVARAIGNGGSGGLTKLGEGTLTLTSTSVVDFGGSITVAGGTTATSALVLGVADALPSGTNIELGLSGIAGGYLDIGGFTTTLGDLQLNNTGIIAGSADLNFTGNAEVHGSAARTLTVNNTGLTTFNGDFFVLVDRGGTARALTINGTGNVTINSKIVDGVFAGSLSYTGSGTLTLTASNTYTGLTTLNNTAGSLVFSGASQLSGLALTVNAGTVQLNPAFDQTVGNLIMGGGAAGSTSNLLIGAGRTLTLGGTVTFLNTNNPLVATIDGGAGAILDFGGSARTFTVGDSTNAEPDMIIGANVTLQNDGGGGLIKLGTGTLHIAGTNNLTGPISIQAGSVTGNLGTGNLLLNNGVYEGNDTFTRSLGTGNGQVQWVAGASGGFAASGGDLTVTLAGAPTPLVWNSTPFFVSGAGALLFGSTTADSVVTFTHDLDLNSTASAVTRTIQVNDNTDVTTDKAVLSGVLSNSGAGVATLTKAGAGILELTGTNTFSAFTVAAGTLQFSTVTNNGGGPSNLGQGTDSITLSGGILSFIGDGVANSQSTNRAITVTASSTLNAAGTNGATITYTGAITAGALQVQLTGSATSAGFITGGIIQNTTAPDLLVSSGNWTLSGTTVVVGDDVKINGIGTVLNLDSTGVLSYVTGSSNFVYVGNGGTVNLNANDVSSTALGLEGILVGFETAGAVTTLNLKTFDITTTRLDVGQIANGFEGEIIGSGTMIVTGTTAGAGLSLYRGAVAANLAGGGAFFKGGMGDVILSGDNSGLTGTIRLDAGNLILDYTISNTNKINAATALDMRGGTLTINGSASAATSQTVASYTLGSGGASTIAINGGAGQNAVLNLGVITRANGSQDGTVRFDLSSGPQSATHGITTSTTNGTHGLLGLSGFATVTDSTGTWFATNATNVAGGNIVALASTISNDVMTWLPGDQITDDTTGFTGTLNQANINSLRFNAAGGSAVNIASGGVLTIASGGILVTDNVTSGTPGIFGGTLISGVLEIIVTQDSPQTFEISSNILGGHAVTKTGVGTLLLSGSNTYTGATEIQNGTLQISGGNAIGDTSLVTLADDQYNILQLLADETIGRLAGGSAAAGLNDLATVDVGSHTLTFNQNAASTYAGLITGSGALVKNGALFDLTLTGISSGFTGALQINGGGVILSGVAALAATSIEINKGGYLRFVDSSTTRSGTRIPDATPITLNSADGGIAGNLLPRGLYINTDQGSTLDETVGVITLGSGASYATLESTVASGSSDIIMANLLRTNDATLDVRGTNLGTTNTQGNQFRIGNTANQTAFIATLVGGGGAVSTKNINIVTWAIGETLSGALAATNMGNSLVTYVSGAGLRPLDFTTEYNTYSAAGVTDNVRESLSADLTGLAGKTLNALVIDNKATLNDISFTGSGAGQTLTNTSGAFLFTLNTAATASTAYSITLGGFDGGIAVGGSNEYVFFVVNPSSVATTATLTATVTSPLISTADITKSGRGTLILSGTNTAGGDSRTTTINEGTLEITDLDNIGGNTGGLVFSGGTLRLSSAYSSDDLSTRSITFFNGGGTLDTNGNDLTLAGSLGTGVGGFTKTGLGTLTLTAAATYTGPTTIQAGTLSIASINNVGAGPSPLGAPATVADGTINIGFTTGTTATLNYTGAGSTSDRLIGLSGTTGGATLDADGTGALVLGGALGTTAGAKTLTLQGSSAVGVNNGLGPVDNGLGTLSVLKTEANTWEFNAANSYSGATSINDGILRFTADQNLSGALNFGSANTITTAGTLDLSNASATFAGNLLVQTNTAAETNQILIGAGETLTVGGTVTLGSSATNSTTLFSAVGEGALNVINTTGTGVTFLVGNSNTNNATADFSALATMNVSLNTTSGILQVGSTSGTNSTGFGTLILAQDTTITASALTVGGGGSYNSNAGQINSLKLGTSTNVFNVDAVNIGTGARDLGSITFQDSNGTLTIRAADGVSAAAFNMASINGATGALLPAGNRNTFDVTGHTADLLFGTVTIGTQVTRTGPMENLFAFDTGTLTTGNLIMGSKTAAGNSTNVINLGGGIVTIGSGTDTAVTLGSNTSTGAVSAVINVTGGTVTIGSGTGQSLIMGSSNTGTGSTTTALNVSGGNVTLATTGATAVTLANASAGTANATMSVTGGTLTVQGDIVRGTGAGTRNAAVMLNGGTLDMTRKSIGASANAITFNAQSGTLKNLAELNGGGALNKTTSGTLYMDGVNSYTGTTTVTAGTLQFLLETAFYNNTPASWTATNLVVNSGATAAFNVGGTGEFTASDVDLLKSLGTPTGGFKDGSTLGLDTTNTTGGSFTYGGVIADTNSGANRVGLEKLGTHTLALTQTSTYTGATTVTAGTLQVGDGTSGALAGSGIVTVSATATLSGSGSIAGATVISSGAVLAPGVGVTDTSNQTLTFTAAGTALDVQDGGQIQLSLTSSSQVDAAFDFSGDALTYLNNDKNTSGTAYATTWDQSGDYDSIQLTNGTFNLGTTAGGTIKVINHSATLNAGNIFKLLDWSTVGMMDSLAGTGSFTTANLDLSGVSLDPGLSWDTSAFTTYGVIVVVPEPARSLLLMLGLCSFLLRRRRTVI